MAAWWHCSPQLGLTMFNIILNTVLNPKQIIITVMAIVKDEFTFTNGELDQSAMGKVFFFFVMLQK